MPIYLLAKDSSCKRLSTFSVYEQLPHHKQGKAQLQSTLKDSIRITTLQDCKSAFGPTDHSRKPSPASALSSAPASFPALIASSMEKLHTLEV
mmetsp:Transcript_5860/g.36345  ORF Transcript_5860/g.36345 Transcript_5860/m.36345 type:complete len:93 (+) Transcript_5860:810-1088(+)